jgi:hypothetical protein
VVVLTFISLSLEGLGFAKVIRIMAYVIRLFLSMILALPPHAWAQLPMGLSQPSLLSPEEWQSQKQMAWHQLEFARPSDSEQTAMVLEAMPIIDQLEEPSVYADAFLLGFMEKYKTNKSQPRRMDVARPSAVRLTLTKEVLLEALSTYEPIQEELGNFIDQDGMNLLIEQVDSRMARLSALAGELRRMRGSDLPDEDLIANPDYMTMFYRYKSCELTYFGSPGLAGTVANLDFPQVSSYLRERGRETLKPNLPLLSPAQTRVQNFQESGVRLRLEPYQYDQALPHLKNFYDLELSQVHANLNEQIRRTQTQLTRIEDKLSQLDGRNELSPRERQQTRLSTQRVYDEMITVLAAYPYEFGKVLAQRQFSSLDIPQIFTQAHNYFQDERRRFGNQLLVTGGMALASLFIPGGVLLAGIMATVRLSNMVYGAVTTYQAGMIVQYIRQFHSEHVRMQAMQIFEDPTGFVDYHAEEVLQGLWDGGLAMAFIGFGEVLGVANVGSGVVTQGITRFARWGRWLGMKLNNRRMLPFYRRAETSAERIGDMTNPRPGFGEAVGNFTDGLDTAVGAAQMFQQFDQSSLARARDLVEWLQGNQQFQRDLRAMVMRFEGDKEKRIFLDAAIEDTFRVASISAQLHATRYEFRRTLMEQLEEMARLSDNIPRFMIQSMGSVTRAGSHTADQIRQLTREFQDLVRSASSATSLADKMSALVSLKTFKSTLDFRIKMIQMGDGIQQTFRALLPLARDNADAAKDLGLQVLEEVIQDPNVSRAFLVLPDMPNYAGPTIWQSRYYMEKTMVMAEIIGDHVVQMGAQGALVTQRLRNELIEAFVRINRSPISPLSTALELNGFLSRLLLQMSVSEGVAQEVLKIDRIRENYLDCSLDL